MTKILSKYWIQILTIGLLFLVSWPLFRNGYFSHQDDLQVIRIVEMRKCFSDLQIPCRWVPDMGWGNGLPLFNFYGVFTYYIGALISFVTGYLVAAKLLFFVALSFGSFGIYLLVKDLWGKYAGLTASVLYLFAPYKALDIYVRGALSESIALALIPFVFYFFHKKSFNWATLFLFMFLITHNIMTVIFLPVLLIWVIYLQIISKFKDIKLILLSFLIAVGMSSFFLVPAFLEKNLVQTESLTRFELNFRANFISIKQLFLDRVWGYGTSIPGPEGGMNFQIGWPHWILAFVSVLVLFINKIDKKTKYLIASIFTIFILSVFMTHNRSAFIWERISILQFFQFPWRFLSLSIFTASILGGFVISIVSEKWQKYLTVLIIILTVSLNWNYFKPREFYNITEADKTTGKLWEEQQKGALLDYLPKTALEPREAANGPIIFSGEAKITKFVSKSNSWELNVEVDKDSKIILPVYYFPNWEVLVNDKKYNLERDKVLGRIELSLNSGNYNVIGYFRNTLLRTISNILSLVSLICFILIFKKWKN